MKKILGSNTAGYPEVRNFFGLPYQKYTFRKKQNFHKIPAVIYSKLTGKIHPYFWNAFRDLDLNRVELFHFFNGISYGKTPWLTTFETMLPRWGDISKKREAKAIKLLAGDPCKKIIALSQCTANMQLNFLQQDYPAYVDVIRKKLMVLHPSQKKQLGSMDDKIISDKIIFTFVGGEFFRKGGKETLLAFDHLFDQGFKNWELNIISSLDLDYYASGATNADIDFAKKLIAKHPNNINHFYYKPNKEVLELLLKTNVGLLPSYADTYGYSVLEAQSAGCPVITTNIRAFPEINDDKSGWVIEVPCYDFGICKVDNEADLAKFSNVLFEGLVDRIKSILLNPSIITTKGKIALERIDKFHSINENTRILESIYDEITGN